MFNISFGCCRHNVSNTFVQLTEGRSARDQPKQPPAKKKCSPVIDPDDDERVHRVLLSSLFCTIRFYHGLSVWCMPIATTDTSVSVDHQQ